ncbi:Ctr copper transporter [Gloeopeniophorella convolvens]|nr:Ctr copper transporter [Gloeopeniophorella convolvens]
MDMDSANSSGSVIVTMIPYLHFTGGDNLLFKSWHPSSHGAIAGASIALLVLAILERFLFATRSTLNARWRKSMLAMSAAHTSEDEGSPLNASGEPKDIHQVEELRSIEQLKSARRQRTIPPFSFSYDVSRGALYSLQALLGYALMLAVMTFQAAYVISIIAGLGIGEFLFGRFAGASL